VILAKGSHPFPSRTRKLSPSAPMVLHAQVCGRVGRRPIKSRKAPVERLGLFVFRGGDVEFSAGGQYSQGAMRAPLAGSVSLRYVEDNPCRAGLVRSPAKYRWSSVAAHLLGEPDRSHILDLRFWERLSGSATWADLHASKSHADQIMALRKCTHSGQPFGEERFVEAMEERFQRKMASKRRRLAAPTRENSIK
jgi:hypothetical protein